MAGRLSWAVRVQIEKRFYFFIFFWDFAKVCTQVLDIGS